MNQEPSSCAATKLTAQEVALTTLLFLFQKSEVGLVSSVVVAPEAGRRCVGCGVVSALGSRSEMLKGGIRVTGLIVRVVEGQGDATVDADTTLFFNSLHSPPLVALIR